MLLYYQADEDTAWRTLDFSSSLVFAKCTDCRGAGAFTFKQLTEPALKAATKKATKVWADSVKALRIAEAKKLPVFLDVCTNDKCGCGDYSRSAGGLHFDCCTAECAGALFHPGHFVPGDSNRNTVLRTLRDVDNTQSKLELAVGDEERVVAKQQRDAAAERLGSLQKRPFKCSSCRERNVSPSTSFAKTSTSPAATPAVWDHASATKGSAATPAQQEASTSLTCTPYQMSGD